MIIMATLSSVVSHQVWKKKIQQGGEVPTLMIEKIKL